MISTKRISQHGPALRFEINHIQFFGDGARRFLDPVDDEKQLALHCALLPGFALFQLQPLLFKVPGTEAASLVALQQVQSTLIFVQSLRMPDQFNDLLPRQTIMIAACLVIYVVPSLDASLIQVNPSTSQKIRMRLQTLFSVAAAGLFNLQGSACQSGARRPPLPFRQRADINCARPLFQRSRTRCDENLKRCVWISAWPLTGSVKLFVLTPAIRRYRTAKTLSSPATGHK